MRNTSDKSMRFITRFQETSWRVWVQFKDLDFGQMYFYDHKLGGKQEALDSAKACRDKLVKVNKIPIRLYTGNGFHIQNTRNTSGGVGIVLDASPKDNPTRVMWKVKNTVEGCQSGVGKSIRKWGYIGAWNIVAKLRQAHTGQEVPELPPPPPEWLIEWAEKRGIDLSM